MMKKLLLGILFLCSVCVNAQTVNTYSSCDTNTDGSVDITDVTNTVNKVLGKAADAKTVVTADDLNTLLQSIDARLKAIEEKLGISTKQTATCSFSAASYTLKVGGTYTQTVTTTSDGAVTYSSSNTSVASVDATTGLVTAKTPGVATITAEVAETDTYDAATATYTVTVQSSGATTTHEYVDLGLSVKWATCNVGADNPQDYGLYFAWGETTGYSSDAHSFGWTTYALCNSSKTSLKEYCTNSLYGTVDNKTTLDLDDDAAYVNWGGTWRMPTNEELTELKKQCTWVWTTMSGVNGYKVTSNVNGNYIFLPAAGNRNGTKLSTAGSYGYYWTSSLYETNPDYAYYLYFGSSDVGSGDYRDRFYGQPVRAVCP